MVCPHEQLQFAHRYRAWPSFSFTRVHPGSHLGKLCEAKKTRLPSPLPRLNVPGVFKLELGPRWTMGVDGTEPVACTAVSVLSASTELGMGVLGFSCFCCTASSCRKSAPGKGYRLSPCFGRWGGGGSTVHPGQQQLLEWKPPLWNPEWGKPHRLAKLQFLSKNKSFFLKKNFVFKSWQWYTNACGTGSRKFQWIRVYKY